MPGALGALSELERQRRKFASNIIAMEAKKSTYGWMRMLMLVPGEICCSESEASKETHMISGF